MTEPLYIQEPVGHTKTAVRSKLSDNSDSWVEEVLQEAHKQHPHLSNYDVSVAMREVDGERGFGFGHLIVRSRTGRLNTPAGQQLAEAAGVKTAKVPIIINEQMLNDIDVFIDPKGRAQPLSEERLKAAMFRPELFDSFSMHTQRPSLIGNYMSPPDRTENMSANSPSATISEIDKLSSARTPLLLEVLAPTMTRADIDRLESEMDTSWHSAEELISKHGSLMKTIAKAEPLELSKVASAVRANIAPDTVQLTRLPDDRYRLKLASSQWYEPEVLFADHIKMASVVGEDLMTKVDDEGEVTLSHDPVVKQDAMTSVKVEPIKDFGEYRVMDKGGREHLGWVFPVIDFSAVSLPLYVFTNGTVAAVQDSIAGSAVGKGTNIVNSDRLEGQGFFYMLTEDGSALALPPGKIEAAFTDTQGPALRFNSSLEEVVTLRLVAGLRAPSALGPGEYGIPAHVKWCPLPENTIDLASSAEEFLAPEALRKTGSLHIIGNSSTYTFRGDPVSGLPAEECKDLDLGDALFLSAALGMEPKYAKEKLCSSNWGSGSHVEGCRPIRTLVAEVERSAAKV